MTHNKLKIMAESIQAAIDKDEIQPSSWEKREICGALTIPKDWFSKETCKSITKIYTKYIGDK